MEKARKFLEKKINLFLTEPLNVEVISTSGYKVSYRNVISEAYKAYHKQFLRHKDHHDAFNDYVKMVCPSFFDQLTWSCTMHQDQRQLVMKYHDQIEINFLTYKEFSLLKPLAMQEKRLVDRRMGPEQKRFNKKTRKEMKLLYDWAYEAHEGKKPSASAKHKEITGGTTNSQTTNVAWGYMKRFQDRIRAINRDQTFGFVNKPTLDNVIPLPSNEVRNQNIM
tara:strand:+ start:434 stop:1099 length:666 start_codon:yes stop_codon:yes gene_type:complete